MLGYQKIRLSHQLAGGQGKLKQYEPEEILKHWEKNYKDAFEIYIRNCKDQVQAQATKSKIE